MKKLFVIGINAGIGYLIAGATGLIIGCIVGAIGWAVCRK